MSAITKALQSTGIFATRRELDLAVADLRKRAAEAVPGRFEIARMIRGGLAMKGFTLNPQTKEADIAYARALDTGNTPGSYLVPIKQAAEIIELLNDAGVLRRMGPETWPMSGTDKLDIPADAASPTVEYLGQNTQQSADTALDYGQVQLRLKTRRSLVPLPNELIRSSTPAVDAAVSRLLAIGFADHEDQAFFATSALSGGPTPVFAASGVNFVNSAGSGNGGPVRYVDLLNVLKTAYANKARGPFVWAFHPNAFFGGILNLLDLQSRPIVQSTAADNGVNFSIFGWPVFLSSNIPTNQTLGSGTNLTYGLFTNPRYLHIGEDGSGLEIAVSTEFAFDKNQTVIRGVHRHDFGYGPAAGITILRGIAA